MTEVETVKQTQREKQLGMKSIFDITKVSITLKEAVDEINRRENLKKGGSGFIEHNKAMKKVESLMALNEGFGQCAVLSHCYINGNNANQTINTYQLDKKQALTVAAALNDRVLLWVMNRFEEMENIIREHNVPKLSHNDTRELAVESNKKWSASIDTHLVEGQGRGRGIYASESIMVFKVAMGMSQSKYRKLNGLDKKEHPRAHMSERELSILTKVGTHDANIMSYIFDHKEREKQLKAFRAALKVG